jgi:TatD DNase family protein
MAPVPHRGKPAHPGYIPLIAQQIAQLKQISVQQVYSATLRNTKLMYGIPFL